MLRTIDDPNALRFGPGTIFICNGTREKLAGHITAMPLVTEPTVEGPTAQELFIDGLDSLETEAWGVYTVCAYAENGESLYVSDMEWELFFMTDAAPDLVFYHDTGELYTGTSPGEIVLQATTEYGTCEKTVTIVQRKDPLTDDGRAPRARENIPRTTSRSRRGCSSTGRILWGPRVGLVTMSALMMKTARRSSMTRNGASLRPISRMRRSMPRPGFCIPAHLPEKLSSAQLRYTGGELARRRSQSVRMKHRPWKAGWCFRSGPSCSCWPSSLRQSRSPLCASSSPSGAERSTSPDHTQKVTPQ